MNEKISIRKAPFAKIGLQDFCDFIKKNYKKEIILAEIGSYVGDSTEIFAKNFKTIYSIDPWENGYDDNDGTSNSDMSIAESQFDELVEQFSNIKKNKGKSLDFVNNFEDEFFDVVYIDGNHQYEPFKEDLKAWLPKVKKGGFITGHDWGQKNFPGIEKAVREILGEPDITFRDTSWIKQL